jgi:phosphoglycerate-specific signal transduction histidine kinase
MDQKNKSKTKFTPIALTGQAIEKIDGWCEQVFAVKPVRISRCKFLNWWLETALDQLSDEQVDAAIKKFYSREKHLRQLLREVENAKTMGEEVDLEFITK